MDPTAPVRLQARACHEDALRETAGDRSATAIVEAAAARRDLEIVPFRAGTRHPPGVLGAYEPIGLLVSVDASLSAELRAEIVAGAIARHDLRRAGDEDAVLGGPAPSSPGWTSGPSRREAHDLAAEAFAAELLCPADEWLSSELVVRRRRSGEIARGLGLRPRLVTAQAARAVCLPPLQPPAPRPARPLDPLQTAAATWRDGPLLIDAGPGTGKSATLVGRVAHLVASGVPPAAILVVTFSSRAADALRSRIADAVPGAVDALRVGTIHAFGREILNRWHHRVGRGSQPQILDPDRALQFLERNLDALPVTHFLDLGDPAAGLAPVLRIIGRCKDEMIGPREFSTAVAPSSARADETSARVAEVAAIYDAYERLLERGDALDLGDLVARAAELVENDGFVARHYRETLSHLIVDEAQDLNGADSRLLRALCGPATLVWAVGDGRQSIFRFRGAWRSLADDFARTFGGSTIALERTYRATPQIVTAFSTFAAATGRNAPAWLAQRPDGAPVHLLSAPSFSGEMSALRDRISDLRTTGVPYAAQAVLARTHRTLDRIGAELERLGTPVLHLGDLFARDDVRALLSMLSIDAEPGGVGLVRVATLPPYDVPRADAVAAVRWAAARGSSIGEALTDTIPGVSARGMRGLRDLGRHLAAAGPSATAWSALTNWLFEVHGAWTLCDGTAPPSRRIGVFQLLRLAAEDGKGRKAFLARVRRLTSTGRGHEHGVAPPEAEALDAVRLMTVHAAKGLEFDAVFLPMASANHVPLPRRGDAEPMPPGLPQLAMSEDDHVREEQALWFVALSRARDHLTLSRADVYGRGRAARPSPFLAQVGDLVRTRRAATGTTDAPVSLTPQPSRPVFAATDLDAYLHCPARYRYDAVDGLAGAIPASAHRRLVRAVLAAARRLETSAAGGSVPTYDDGAVALQAAWTAHGLTGDRLERTFRAVADRLVGRLVELVATEVGATYHRATWPVDVGAGLVAVTPHRVIRHPWHAVTLQVLGSRRGDRRRLSERMALLAAGARAAFPNVRVDAEMIDVNDGEVTPVGLGAVDVAAATCRSAITAIERGRFEPKPGPGCASCPYLFICGA